MHFVFIQIKIQMVTTYYFSMQNTIGIEFNMIVVSWVIQMRMCIIQNAMCMLQSVMRLGKYGDINQVLMRILNLNMEGENKFMLKKSK